MSKILSGPIKEIIVPNLSLGEWMYKSLRAVPDDFQILIEGDTDRFITAKDFLKQACGLATSLKEYDLQKGDCVGIIGGTSIDLTIAALGTLLAGGVMCPFDPLLKSYEFQHLLKITEPKIVICDDNVITEVQDALQKTFPRVPLIVVEANKASMNKIRFESLLKNVAVEDFTPADCANSKTELAAIVCSSGTTGMPKGVALSHWSLAYQVQLVLDFWPGDLSILHTSYFYWISGILMFVSTTCMAKTRILVKTCEPSDSFKAIHKYKPAVSMLAPSLLTAMVFHPDVSLYDLSSMKTIISGGSPVQKASVEKLKEIIPDCLVIQGYGCTELGGIISKTDATTDTLSVGVLAENIKVKVLDKSTREILGPNQDGELVCWSPTVMLGYHGNKEATKASVDDQGWFYTGDIGRYSNEGLLYITGRAKELMKVDNHQISPSEIESVIADVAGVLDVAVAGIDVKENTFPMALVVKKKGATVTEQEIKAAVEGKLSDFKQLRGGVYFVDAIPRTSTGKIKRLLVQPMAAAAFKARISDLMG